MAILRSLLFLSLLASVAVLKTLAADPDPVFDFNVTEKMPQDVSAADFVFKGLRDAFRATPPSGPGRSINTAANLLTFPVLSTQGVSLTLLNFGANGGENAPHVHPRATEIFFLVSGVLEIALVDTDQRVFRNTLYPGDVTVFPRGLAHFQINKSKQPALAVAGFNSANPGVVPLQASFDSLKGNKR